MARHGCTPPAPGIPGTGGGSADRPQHEASTQDLGPPLHLSTTRHRRFRSSGAPVVPRGGMLKCPMPFTRAAGPDSVPSDLPGLRNCQSATGDGDKSLRIARLAPQHEPRPSPYDLGSSYRLFGPTGPYRPSSGCLWHLLLLETRRGAAGSEHRDGSKQCPLTRTNSSRFDATQTPNSTGMTPYTGGLDVTELRTNISRPGTVGG